MVRSERWRAVTVAVAMVSTAGCLRAGYREPVPTTDLSGGDSAFGFGDGPLDTAPPVLDLAPDGPLAPDTLGPPNDLAPLDPGWEALSFVGEPVQSPCAGARWVKFVPQYNLWVGAILCSPQRYKLMLATSRTAQYYEIGDCNGHGQDNCELVNPDFTLPVSDDITSACPTCAIQGIGSIEGTAGFHRCDFGQPFAFAAAMTAGKHSYSWIECAITIP